MATTTLRQILSSDLEGKGVTVLPDVTEIPAAQAKYKFEQIVREVIIPIFNQDMEEIEAVLYIDPETGSTYLTTGDELSTYEAVLANADTKKVPAAIAVKAMDTALKTLISNAVTAAQNGDATLNTSLTALAGRVSTLEGKANTYDGKFQTVEGNIAAIETTGWMVFDKNDGTDLPDKKSVKCTFNYTANTAKIPSTAPTFSRAGYTFLGWAESRSAGAAEYQTGDTISNLDQHSYGNMVMLNAVWQENEP